MKRLLVVLIPLVLIALPLQAQQAPAKPAPQALVITASNLTAQADSARGAKRKDGNARPADVIRYRLVFTNVTGKPIRDVVLSNPLPGEMRFVGGSNRASAATARAEFSIDGGKSFSARPTVEVVENGRKVVKPADPEQYTNVRWTVGDWVQPGATVTAEYQTRLAGAPRVATSTAQQSTKPK